MAETTPPNGSAARAHDSTLHSTKIKLAAIRCRRRERNGPCTQPALSQRPLPTLVDKKSQIIVIKISVKLEQPATAACDKGPGDAEPEVLHQPDAYTVGTRGLPRHKSAKEPSNVKENVSSDFLFSPAAHVKRSPLSVTKVEKLVRHVDPLHIGKVHGWYA